jgi:hypothetical protein
LEYEEEDDKDEAKNFVWRANGGEMRAVMELDGFNGQGEARNDYWAGFRSDWR